jgi:hypothetical protein
MRKSENIIGLTTRKNTFKKLSFRMRDESAVSNKKIAIPSDIPVRIKTIKNVFIIKIKLILKKIVCFLCPSVSIEYHLKKAELSPKTRTVTRTWLIGSIKPRTP